MSKQFQLVFEGETLQGFDPDDVRRQVGEHMQLDDVRLSNLFSGRRVVLKRGVDQERAYRHVRQFARLGGRLQIEPDDGPPPAPRPPRPPSPSASKVITTAPRPPVVAHDSPPTTAPMPMQLSAPPMVRHPAPAPDAVLAALSDPKFALVPTAEEAEERITCPKCGELQPKTVFCRACSTNMPMGIAARAEAEEQARSGRRHSEADHKAATGPGSRMVVGRGLAEQAPSLLGFGFRGRLSRRGYAMGSAVSFLLAWLMLLFAIKNPSVFRFLLAALVWLPLSVYGVRLTVLRCHDINRSGWWSLLLMLPFIGILAALALALIPGTDGDNEHGEMPDEGNKLVTSLVTGVCALAIGLLIKPALNQAEADVEEAQFAAATAPPPLDEAADRELHSEYAASPGHKAFAATQGAYGWQANANTTDEAEEAALATCEARRPPKALPCEVVDLNGVAVPRYSRLPP